MAADAVTKPTAETDKKKRTRSPNYPAVGLKGALDRTRKFYELDGKAGAPIETAARHIGYSAAHGEALSMLAALKSFGLLEDKAGRVAPTQRAIELLHLPEQDPRRLEALRAAALAPAIYKQLIQQYKETGLPSDDTLKAELVAYKGFNPSAVGNFISGFRETLKFSGLSDFSVLGSAAKVDEGAKKPQIGDYVQWEHNGILGLPQSKKLVRFSEDGQFGFVEGSDTGLPTSEIVPADPPEQSLSGQVPLRNVVRMPELGKSAQGAKMKQDVFSLAEGEVVLSWPTPLSADSIEDLKAWLTIMERKIARSVETTDVILPQCQCAGCTDKAHRNAPGLCTGKANATGTVFCTACEAARKIDSDQFAQTL